MAARGAQIKPCARVGAHARARARGVWPAHTRTNARVRACVCACTGEGADALFSAQAAFEGAWARAPPAPGSDAHAAACAYLCAHGHEHDEAARLAEAPYDVRWERANAAADPEDEEASGAFVLTSSTPGRPDRACVYPVGEWEEPLEGPSTIFGAGGAGGDGGSGDDSRTVFRCTTWVRRPCGEVSHVTESGTPLGWERCARAVDASAGVMTVERSFTPRQIDGTAGEEVSCVETFRRVAA